MGLMLTDKQAEIVRRLRSAEGHLDAIIDMLEAGEPCEPISFIMDNRNRAPEPNAP